MPLRAQMGGDDFRLSRRGLACRLLGGGLAFLHRAVMLDLPQHLLLLLPLLLLIGGLLALQNMRGRMLRE